MNLFQKTLLFLVIVMVACYFYGTLPYFGGVDVKHPEPRSIQREGLGSAGVQTAAPIAKSVPDDKEKRSLAFKGAWKTWRDVNSPGIYRGCVSRPNGNVSMSEVVTGGLVEKFSKMTITRCVKRCIAKGFTYATLSRGSECFCSDVKGESPLLNYTDSTHCDMPCPGERKYHCGGKEFMSLYRTSVLDSRCSEAKLAPKGSLPLIALASFPSSGNTWTRQLIERATGHLTGCIWWKLEKSWRIYKKTFPGVNVDYHTKQTICVKTHLAEREHIQTFEGALLLIRNPYRSLVSRQIRHFMQKESNEEKVQYFYSSEWKERIKNQSVVWSDLATGWIINSPKIHVTHYENLQRNTYEELAKMVQFLNVPVQKERLLCAIQENPSFESTGVTLGSFGRHSRSYLTSNPFSAELRKFVDDAIRKVNATLLEHKLSPLPTYRPVEVF